VSLPLSSFPLTTSLSLSHNHQSSFQCYCSVALPGEIEQQKRF
jgi:hypothetical protein